MGITVGDIGDTIKTVTRSPLGLGLLAGGATYFGTKILYPQVVDAALRVYSMFPGVSSGVDAKGNRVFTPQQRQELAEAKDEFNETGWKRWLPVGLGAAAATAMTVPFLDFRKGGAPWAGLFTWERPALSDTMQKSGSLMFNPDVMNDQLAFDVHKLERVDAIKQEVLKDPTMPMDVKGSMLNIMDGAQQIAPNKTTLGNIFDSARSVIEDNLSVGGIIGTGVRGVLGLGGAKIVTTALDTIMDLTPKQRTFIENAGMWSNAVSPILGSFIDRVSGYGSDKTSF